MLHHDFLYQIAGYYAVVRILYGIFTRWENTSHDTGEQSRKIETVLMKTTQNMGQQHGRIEREICIVDTM